MFLKLFLLFTITPMVELYILIKMGQVVGAFETVVMVIIIGLAGAALARSQGYEVVRRFQTAMQRGEMPTDQIIDGLLVVAGGAMLVTPGVLTDLFGLALVAPPTRIYFRAFVKSRVMMSFNSPGGAHFYYRGPTGKTGGRDPGRPGQDDRDNDVIDV
ncbi:MAG: FxsA family protein [Nitrospinota bacterium]|nr:FxsA family protein [Nitrospinota bacterium]